MALANPSLSTGPLVKPATIASYGAQNRGGFRLIWRRAVLIIANAIVLLALLGLAAWTIMETDRRVSRLERLHGELESIQDLDAASGHYGAQLAQLLWQGREQQADLRAARLDMERAFVRLSQAARERAAAAMSATETQEALKDVEQARRKLDLYHAIDLAASRAIVLERDFRSADALQIYEKEVDFRLATEFTALLDDARAGAAQRLDGAREANTTAHRQLLFAWSAAAALAVATLGFTVALLGRFNPGNDELAQAFEARAEELRDSNRRLREIDTRRSQFLADVSHELRTPLTILRGEADVALLPNSQANDQRRSLERIQDQAAELAQLLDDLIAFARSEGDQKPLQLAPLLLDDLVAAAAQEGETLAEPREVTLDLQLPDKSVWVAGDMRRLKQALMIGIDNAINHSPPGSVIGLRLDIRASGAHVLIMDRGPGLTEHDEPHIFDRYYRGGDTGRTFGLGIGLAIAKGIIEQHQGSIGLSNRDGGGAILTITLPLPDGPVA